eukprot:scaffold2798_cov160-Ochromonas_danica.AAC.31
MAISQSIRSSIITSSIIICCCCSVRTKCGKLNHPLPTHTATKPADGQPWVVTYRGAQEECKSICL